MAALIVPFVLTLNRRDEGTLYLFQEELNARDNSTLF